MEISQALANFRKKAGVSQYDVAAKIGIRQSVYSRYEQGINIPSAEVIRKIACAYNVSTDYLLGLKETPNKEFDEKLASVAMDFFRKIKPVFESTVQVE